MRHEAVTLEAYWGDQDDLIVPIDTVSVSARDYTKDPITFCEICDIATDGAEAIRASDGIMCRLRMCIACSSAVVTAP